MELKLGYQALVAQAMSQITSISVVQAQTLLDDSNTLFVDIRDIRELERDGMIPGAFHAPRGMLEFWVDPVSPYYKSVFGEGKRLVLYCAAAWRSALAVETLQKMGVPNVVQLEGGLGAWKQAELPIKQIADKPHSG